MKAPPPQAPAAQEGSGAWPAQVSITVSDAGAAGLAAITEEARRRWGLAYDRPELLRLVTQIAIGAIETGLVGRQGLHFALAAPVVQPLAAAPAGAPPAGGATRGRPRAQTIWVGGGTSAGLAWVHAWMQDAGAGEVPRGAALELAVDLSLQALAAGLVPRPRGPYVTLTWPRAPGAGGRRAAAGDAPAATVVR